MPFESQQRVALEPLQLRQLGFRREQRREWCEIQRHPLDALVARPIDCRADEPFIEAVRRVAKPGHRREGQGRAGPAEREMQEPCDRAVGGAADDK